MKRISKPRLPIEIYTTCQNLSFDNFRRNSLPDQQFQSDPILSPSFPVSNPSSSVLNPTNRILYSSPPFLTKHINTPLSDPLFLNKNNAFPPSHRVYHLHKHTKTLLNTYQREGNSCSHWPNFIKPRPDQIFKLLRLFPIFLLFPPKSLKV